MFTRAKIISVFLYLIFFISIYFAYSFYATSSELEKRRDELLKENQKLKSDYEELVVSSEKLVKVINELDKRIEGTIFIKSESEYGVGWIKYSNAVDGYAIDLPVSYKIKKSGSGFQYTDSWILYFEATDSIPLAEFSAAIPMQGTNLKARKLSSDASGSGSFFSYIFELSNSKVLILKSKLINPTEENAVPFNISQIESLMDKIAQSVEDLNTEVIVE